MPDDEKVEYWDKLRQLGVSKQTLKIVTAINGYSIETLDDILYAHTGYRSLDQVPPEDFR